MDVTQEFWENCLQLFHVREITSHSQLFVFFTGLIQSYSFDVSNKRQHLSREHIDKWMRQASGLEKTSICLQYSDVPPGPVSGGRRTAAGWEGELRKDNFFFLVSETPIILGAVCPSLGAAIPIEARGGLWLQKFLQIKKWPFYISGWGKDVGRKACKGMIFFLGYRALPR